jgi:hypothetical protein
MLSSTPDKNAANWKENIGIPEEKSEAMDTSS